MIQEMVSYLNDFIEPFSAFSFFPGESCPGTHMHVDLEHTCRGARVASVSCHSVRVGRNFLVPLIQLLVGSLVESVNNLQGSGVFLSCCYCLVWFMYIAA